MEVFSILDYLGNDHNMIYKYHYDMWSKIWSHTGSDT